MMARTAIKAFVLHPALRTGRLTKAPGGITYIRDQALKLEEAKGLARAIGLDICAAEIVGVAAPSPATLLGAGKVADFAARIAAASAGVVILDCALSPVQQRNLERAWKAKVLDRTGLILEIFGERARTSEGALQVELAHLTYQKSRLVRTWTHLERQRGGFGFLGGPGERQIEADRRQIQERITHIRKELAAVARRRALHRKARQAVPYPVVALAGYTNAGKSTLFNHLTGAAVEAGARLFETLDPTLRAVKLPGGRKAILSDTVGFISDLPTELVAAFRATLEEVLEADLILHVRDASNPEADAQKADVLAVLHSLGVADSTPILEVFNKIDLLDPEEAAALANRCRREATCVAVSALAGEGGEALLEMMAHLFDGLEPEVVVTLGDNDTEARAWLYAHGSVADEIRAKHGARLHLRLADKAIGRFRKKFPGVKMIIVKGVRKTA